METYTVNELEAITERANKKRNNLFDEMKWKHKPRLTVGDIRMVLEAMQELFIKK